MREVLRGIGALGCAAALSAGSHLWSRALGEPDPRLSVQIRSIAGHASGAALVAGSLTGRIGLDRPLTSSPAGKDPFVLLFDSDGGCRQSLLLGGAGARDLTSAAFDPAGDVILAGDLTGSLELGGRRLVTPDHHPSSGFVARLDRGGQLRWLKHLTSEPRARMDIHGAAASARGSVVAFGYVDGKRLSLDGAGLGVSGQFAVALDPAGRVTWSKSLRYGAADAQPPALDPSGNAVFAFVSESLERIHLVKLDPSGNQLWRQGFGGGITQDLTGLAVDSAGDIILAGHGGLDDTPPEGENAFVARLDPEGHVLSVRRGKQLAYADVALGDRDSVLVTGSAPLSADWSGAAVRGTGPRFVARLDARLRPVWVVRLEGDAGHSLTVGSIPGRAALLAGSFRGPITLGGRPIPGGAGQNAFAAALAP